MLWVRSLLVKGVAGVDGEESVDAGLKPGTSAPRVGREEPTSGGVTGMRCPWTVGVPS